MAAPPLLQGNRALCLALPPFAQQPFPEPTRWVAGTYGVHGCWASPRNPIPPPATKPAPGTTLQSTASRWQRHQCLLFRDLRLHVGQVFNLPFRFRQLDTVDAEKGGGVMKSASSSSRTTFVSGVVPKGGTYALHSVSPHRPPAASPRRRLSANRTEAQAVQTGLYSRRAAQRYPLRRRLAAVAGPRLWPLARRPLRRHPARCPRLSVRRPRPTPAPTQPLARGLRPILGPPPRPTPETPRLPRGHRPDPHPLLRSRGLDPLDLPRQ